MPPIKKKTKKKPAAAKGFTAAEAKKLISRLTPKERAKLKQLW